MIKYPLEFIKQPSPFGYFINMSFNNKVDYKWSIETYDQVCFVLEAIFSFYSYKKGFKDTVDHFSKYGYITLNDGFNLCLPELLITEELSPVILIEYFNETGDYYTSYVDFSFILKDKKTPIQRGLAFYNSLEKVDQQLFNEIIDQQTVDLAYAFLEETIKDLSSKETKNTYNASLIWSTRDFN